MSDLPILEGALVCLRPLDIERDKQGYYEMSLDKNIHEWVGNTVPQNVEEIEKLLKKYDDYFYLWIIEEKSTGKLIGVMRISFPELFEDKLVAGDSQRLHSDYWRKGYMKEARKLMYNYVFNNLQVQELLADVWEGNTNSQKSLESVGYEVFDEKMDRFNKYEREQNRIFLKLTREKWLSVTKL